MYSIIVYQFFYEQAEKVKDEKFTSEANTETYLHWDSFCNVHYQLYVGVVVIVGPTRYRHIMVCHFNVFYRGKGITHS